MSGIDIFVNPSDPTPPVGVQGKITNELFTNRNNGSTRLSTPNPTTATGFSYNGYQNFTVVLADYINGDINKVILNINPNELIFTSPYKVTPIQTMGGAFLDIWGNGIRRLSLKGTTGWRTYSLKEQVHDGYANMFAFKDLVDSYINLRVAYSKNYDQEYINAKLQLRVIDGVNNLLYNVVPEKFDLERNRANSLIANYDILLIVLENHGITSKDRLAMAKADLNLKHESLKKSLKEYANYSQVLSNKGAGIGGQYGTFISSVSTMTGDIADKAHTLLGLNLKDASTIKKLSTFKNSASKILTGISHGMGVIQSYSDFSRLAADVRMVFSEVKSNINDVQCLIEQFTHFGLYNFNSNIFGVTGCSTLFGIPQSKLSTTVNSFATLKNNGNSTISFSNKNVSKAMLQADSVLNVPILVSK